MSFLARFKPNHGAKANKSTSSAPLTGPYGETYALDMSFSDSQSTLTGTIVPKPIAFEAEMLEDDNMAWGKPR